MKNTLYRILTVALLGAVVLACQKPAPEVSMSDTSISVGSDAARKSINVTSNYPWTASSSDSWIHLSPASGEEGTTPLTISVDENTSPDERKGTVIVSCEGITAELPVIQAQKNTMTVEGNSAKVPAKGGNVQIILKSNISYTISCSESWVKEASTKSYDTYTHTFVVEENPRYDPRTATITFTAGAITHTYVIEQEQNTALLVDKDTYEFSSEAATFEVPLRTNLAFDVLMPEADWIHFVETKALKDYTLVFSIDANADYDARSAEILLKAQDSDLQQVLKVSQAQKDALILSGEKTFDIPAEGGAIELKIASNVSYEIELPDWIRQTDTKGLEEHTHVFSVDANPGTGQRSGRIVFTDKSSGLSETVAVIQEGQKALQQLRITHSLQAYTLPGFTGADLTGTIDWGDGKTEAFKAGRSHTYKSAGTYTVIVELEDVQTFSIPDVQSVSAIDLSRFRK